MWKNLQMAGPWLLRSLLALSLGAGWTLAAATAQAQECARIHEVEITFEFTPKELRIRQGECVRFVNIHQIEHSAVGLKREFNTGQLMPGGRALITFDQPGEIPYWCAHHPPMQARLVVEPR
jgi:plastocyanin